MRNCIAAAAFLAFALPLSARPDDDAKTAAKKLEGTYTVVEATKGGKPEPKAADVKAFTIKDGKITIEVKDEKDHVAKFTVDPAKKPAEIEVTPEDGAMDKAMMGIYMTKETDKGLELTIALGIGPDAPRPKNFEGKGEQEMLIKLLRKK
jgi:uncharacterized protein (TIGR03067 family)